MHTLFDITSPSPDGQHTAHFAFSGEIRFGPAYYALSVDGSSFDQRIFGSAHLWSPSSTLLAVQEWLTLDYSEGPITALVLIDVHLRRELTVAQATKKFMVPDVFEGSIIVYREEHAGRDVIKHFDLDAAKLKAWKKLGR
jgi:hypothetical protein